MSDTPEERAAERKGFQSAIDIVKRRLAHYELYRCNCGYQGAGDLHTDACPGKNMTTHPATFAVFDEVLVFLEAQFKRMTLSP